jgi:hypothetical protein
MTNEKAPHQAVMLLKIDIHELLPTGECSGKQLTREEIHDCGLSKSVVLLVNGKDKQDCVDNLISKLEVFRNE